MARYSRKKVSRRGELAVGRILCRRRIKLLRAMMVLGLGRPRGFVLVKSFEMQTVRGSGCIQVTLKVRRVEGDLRALMRRSFDKRSRTRSITIEGL